MKDKGIKSLNSLRGIACLIVLVAHIVATSKYGIYASGCGKIGVWCFMLLFGFFLMLPLINDDKFNIKEFYIKKYFAFILHI